MRYTGEEAHAERGMEISVDICFQLKVAIMSLDDIIMVNSLIYTKVIVDQWAR